MKLTPKALQFDSANNLAKPWPFTNLVGFISRSNSKILAIHLLLLPSMLGWISIYFIEVEGTYATIFECNALLKKEIGCSNPTAFFCNKTSTIVSNEAKENIRISFE
jgi:hypothetical protein